ncbi:hypothetical protein PIB30_084751 [Stylosanthes scabra]|uniref:PB1-like domain-containing protein n=1 Tax=Stylosanthes scabra TaxID=79078 RepID=A0ABU6VUP5_9FABA|nr:hypothetical protein [Stylosanthes scabra]
MAFGDLELTTTARGNREEEMVYFDIKLYHKGHFGYENGEMRYYGEELIIEYNDSDFWCVFEAEEQLCRFGYPKSDTVAMWYKDPVIQDYSVGLRMFLGDKDALEMVRITEQRGYVELFVVHEGGEGNEFPEIGYVDVGGDPGGGDDDDDDADGVGEGNEPNAQNGAIVGDEEAALEVDNEPQNAEATDNEPQNDEAAGNEPQNDEEVDGEGEDNVEANVESGDDVPGGLEEADCNNKDDVAGGFGSDSDDNEDSEYFPSEEDVESAQDVHFTDSEEEWDLDEDFFGF